MSFITENKTSEEIALEFFAIKELVDQATSIDELLEIEEMIGVCALIGANDWEELYTILIHLRSPYADIIGILKDKWEELEE